MLMPWSILFPIVYLVIQFSQIYHKMTRDQALELLHPRHHVPKTYLVKVKGRPDPKDEGLEQLDRYLAGLGLDRGWLVVFDRRAQDPSQPGWSDRLRSEHLPSFADQPLVFVMVMVVGTIGMIIIMPSAAELGRRAE